MSLVNDMLRDLDRRKRHTSDSLASTYKTGEDSEQSGRNGFRFVLLPAVGIVVGITAAYFYFSRNEPLAVNDATIISSQNMEAVDPGRSAPVSNNGMPSSAEVMPDGSPEIGVSIAAAAISASGFSITVASPNEFTYETVARDSFGLNLLLHEVDSIVSNTVDIGGFSMIRSSGGYNVVIELNQMADFSVYRESAAGGRPGMTLLVEAAYRSNTAEQTGSGGPAITEENAPETGSAVEQISLQETAPPAVSPAIQQQAATAEKSSPSPSGNAPVRTARELTFEQLDSQASQNASQLIQRGQMMTAYQELLAFIGENPEAHRSRSTLATLLFAQQEYEQANVIVDQGLGIAPNYGAYKKIKARLYMMNSQSLEASQLLKNLPPALNNDPEYFELLASSFQQNGDFLSAIGVYQDLLRHDNQQGRWWAGLGIAHESLGDVNDAIASFQAAVQRAGLEPALRQYSENRIRYLKQ